MKDWERFKTPKQRGEWVELQFMAEAALHGYHVLKPWGESLEYDVGIECCGGLVRVQVKSSCYRRCGGYRCQIRRSIVAEPYSVDDLELFACFVIPEDVWYLIPAVLILTPTVKTTVSLCPFAQVRRTEYKYEEFREAWGLLGKSREELLQFRK